MTDHAADPAPSWIRDRGGMVIVDKPAGCTSHDVVARCRKVFGLRKVGHAGTLDPDATGVLLIGLGPVTRLLQFLSGLPKTYTAEIVLGVATTTLDAGGDVTGRWDMASVTLDQAQAAAATLTGSIDQIPPMVSAVHVGGRRLHELARAGIEVERRPRTVTVSRFDVTRRAVAEEPVFAVEVECSTGTYVRSLAADLGAALGGGAHLRNLRRTATGPFGVAEAAPLDGLSLDAVRPPIAALAGMAAIEVDPDLADAVGHGKVLADDELGVQGHHGHGPGPWAIVGPAGDLLAVYQAHGPGRVKPIVVLPAPAS
ncbi:MAG: tRNA pseudouridine(55) synthase TruB [Actinomycetota bacterium]|nr:tRNA pseudouridine(55) synthase TruB [Actinomycetota bacterium]